MVDAVSSDGEHAGPSQPGWSDLLSPLARFLTLIFKTTDEPNVARHPKDSGLTRWTVDISLNMCIHSHTYTYTYQRAKLLKSPFTSILDHVSLSVPLQLSVLFPSHLLRVIKPCYLLIIGYTMSTLLSVLISLSTIKILHLHKAIPSQYPPVHRTSQERNLPHDHLSSFGIHLLTFIPTTALTTPFTPSSKASPASPPGAVLRTALHLYTGPPHHGLGRPRGRSTPSHSPTPSPEDPHPPAFSL